MKKVFLLMVLSLMVFSVLLVAENIWQRTIVYERYTWADVEGYYNYADSATFVGSGSDDMGIKSAQTYDGTADSVVKVIVLADATGTDPDTIAWGWAAGLVPSAVTAYSDTAAIDADSVALRANEVYAVFDSIGGHTVGDYWYVPCYAPNDRDTIWATNPDNGMSTETSPIKVNCEKVLFYWRAAATAAATNDSILFTIEGRWGDFDTWRKLVIDTTSASTIKDSALNEFTISSSTYAPTQYRCFIEVAGQDIDTTNYDIWWFISQYDD